MIEGVIIESRTTGAVGAALALWDWSTAGVGQVPLEDTWIRY